LKKILRASKPTPPANSRRPKLKILVTAGPTVEDIDPVRFISNRATGALGVLLAGAALNAGHQVILIHGPIGDHVRGMLPLSVNLRVIEIRSADQMRKAVMKHAPGADIVVMNAAVADFTPAEVSTSKLKKAAQTLTLRLRPTVDILKELGAAKSRRLRVLIGFALETGAGATSREKSVSRESEARRKLASKNLDAIVLDTPRAMGAVGGDFTILTRGGAAETHRACSKKQFAARLISLAEIFFEGRRMEKDAKK
jgi:phosphopantothenoylcysteine decarboxylase/phosphopantothenate--cysteine ligase